MSAPSLNSTYTYRLGPWRARTYEPSEHHRWTYPDPFSRRDDSDDCLLLYSPQFLYGMDYMASAALEKYYDAELPSQGYILDFFASLESHYPFNLHCRKPNSELHIVGLGCNSLELHGNRMFIPRPRQDQDTWIWHDLNGEPCFHPRFLLEDTVFHTCLLEASTCTNGIQYLTWPTFVLKSLLQITRPGGMVHIAVSNCRFHPGKVVDIWRGKTMTQRLNMVAGFLHLAGWEKIDIIEVKRPSNFTHGVKDNLGKKQSDGVWVVRAFRPLSM